MIGGRRRGIRALALCLCLATAFGLFTDARAEAPNVLVTLKPLHSLMVAIMEGAAYPKLLIRGGHSPHGYMLRPSDVKDLGDAQLVVWVGANIETALSRRLADLPESTFIVSPLEFPGMTILKRRTIAVWDNPKEKHSAKSHDEHREIDPADYKSWVDPHIWLDPKNARAFTNTMVGILSGIDRENAALYARNGKKLNYRLIALDREIKKELEPVQGIPFLVFHDGYRYFEHHFGLKPAGVVAIHPEDLPTPRHLAHIKTVIDEAGVQCVFGEPQFKSQIVHGFLAETGATLGLLDPLGANLEPGADLYFGVMRGISGSLADCLSTNIS